MPPLNPVTPLPAPAPNGPKRPVAKPVKDDSLYQQKFADVPVGTKFIAWFDEREYEKISVGDEKRQVGLDTETKKVFEFHGEAKCYFDVPESTPTDETDDDKGNSSDTDEV